MQSVVMELSKKYTLQIETIEKSEMSFIEQRVIKQLPAVVIDDMVISKGNDITL